MGVAEQTEIKASIDDVKILDGILNCIVRSQHDDVPTWYVEYSHKANELEICLPSLCPCFLSIDSFNKHFKQSIPHNFADNTPWSSEIDDEVSEEIYSLYDESDFENELSFHDLVIKVLENIRSKPHLLKSVLASGGVFLTISQHRYARKIVEDFYLWQVDSQIEYKIEEYRTKKSGNKYKIIISCERDYKTTLNDFWHALDGGEDLTHLKARFLEFDFTEGGALFEWNNEASADKWLAENNIDYIDYNLIEYFSFDSIVKGESALIPGAVGYSHEDEEISAFNYSVNYSKKRGADSSKRIEDQDELKSKLFEAKLDLIFPVRDVADLLNKRNYIPSIEYIMSYWLQGRDLEEIEIDWLVCTMSEFGEPNIRSLISEITKKYNDVEIPVDRILDLSAKIPKKLLLQLNYMILKNLPKKRLWDNITKTRDGDFSVEGEVAILKMVCDHNNVDVDNVWRKVAGGTFTEAIEYVCDNKP